MNDAALYENWSVWIGISLVVIIAAAALLIMVNVAALRIKRLAGAALKLVIDIKENTLGVWELQKTNGTASHILQEAQEIDSHITLVADALQELDQNKS